jgi:hypothetical protein
MRQAITVPIVQDGLYEGSETFSLSLSGPSGAVIVSPGSHVVTIVDDDPTPDPRISLESPGDGTIWGSHVSVSGWAIDAHAPSGTGITAVNVYAYPNADESQPAIFLGTASYGAWRQDIATSYGSQFGSSGYSLAAVLPGPGVYRIRAFGYDPLGATWYASNPRDFTVQATPRMNIDVPANGTVASWFWVSGWAIDAGAGSGTGVDVVQMYAYPNPGSGQAAMFLGTATYGGSRPDIGAAYGSQFTPSGYGLYATLGAGYYQVVVYAHSSVTQAAWCASRAEEGNEASARAADRPACGTRCRTRADGAGDDRVLRDRHHRVHPDRVRRGRHGPRPPGLRAVREAAVHRAGDAEGRVRGQRERRRDRSSVLPCPYV